MSGLPWIKVWTVVPQHPKIQRLERELAIRDALGMVVRLWCWTAAYHPDGDIPAGHADSMAEIIAGDAVPADPDGRVTRNARVTQACVTAGLLDPLEGGFRVHDWHEMQTVHVEAEEKRRAQARERQARLRERRSVTSNAPVTRYVTRDSVTEKEREKESREEKNQKPCAEPEEAPAPAPAPAGAPSVVALLPVVGKGPKEYPVTAEKVAEWQESFPGLDVLREVKALVQWARDNPAKRKTYRGAPAFFSRNLARKQDQNPQPHGSVNGKRADPEILRALEKAERYARGEEPLDPEPSGNGREGGSEPLGPAADGLATLAACLPAQVQEDLAHRRRARELQDAVGAQPGAGHGGATPAGTLRDA